MPQLLRLLFIIYRVLYIFHVNFIQYKNIKYTCNDVARKCLRLYVLIVKQARIFITLWSIVLAINFKVKRQGHSMATFIKSCQKTTKLTSRKQSLNASHFITKLRSLSQET